MSVHLLTLTLFLRFQQSVCQTVSITVPLSSELLIFYYGIHITAYIHERIKLILFI